MDALLPEQDYEVVAIVTVTFLEKVRAETRDQAYNKMLQSLATIQWEATGKKPAWVEVADCFVE